MGAGSLETAGGGLSGGHTKGHTSFTGTV